PGVAAEGCRNDLDLINRNCPAALMDGGSHRSEQPGPETCHAAAENDTIRAEDRHQIGDAHAQRSTSAAKNFARNRVACLRCQHDLLGCSEMEVMLDNLAAACRAALPDRWLAEHRNRYPVGKFYETPMIPAPAGLPGGVVRLVADFPRRAVNPQMQPAP